MYAFTLEFRRACTQAQDLARSFGNSMVHPSSLALTALCDEKCRSILRVMKVDFTAFTQDLEKDLESTREEDVNADRFKFVPFSKRAQKVLFEANEEANYLHRANIECEFLLMGLIREEVDGGIFLIRNFLDWDKVRNELCNLELVTAQ